MTVAFDKYISPFTGTTTATSASFTPTAAGEAILTAGFDNNSPYGTSLSFGGTGTYTERAAFTLTPLGEYYFSSNANATGGFGLNASCSSGAQTTHITSATSGHTVNGWGAVYSGVANTQALYFGYTASSTAVTGYPVYVPPGAMLVALCIEATGSNTITVSGGGTSRGSGAFNGYSYNWSDWTGTGAQITPSWTLATTSTQQFWIYQFLLAPTGKVIPIQVGPSNGNDIDFPWTMTLPMSVAIGDVVIVEIAGQNGGSAYPVISISDNINAGGGTWNVINAQFENTDVSSLQMWGGHYFCQFTSAGIPTITITSTNVFANGYGGCIHLAGWAGTPTVDPSAAVTAISNTNTSNQTLTISTAFANEILLAAPWSGDFINAGISGWQPMANPSAIYDGGWYAMTYLNPGSQPFSGTLAASVPFYTVGGGLYDKVTSTGNYVQSTSNQGSGASTLACATAITPGLGDTLICFARVSTPSQISGLTIADGHNSYSLVQTFNDGVSDAVAVYVASNAAAASISPAGTLSSGSSLTSIIVLDYKSIYSLLSIQGQFQTGTSGTSNQLTSTALTLGSVSSLILGFAANMNFSGTVPNVGTSPTAFTSRTTAWNLPSTANLLIEDAISSANIAVTATPASNNYFLTIGMAFSLAPAQVSLPAGARQTFVNTVYWQF